MIDPITNYMIGPITFVKIGSNFIISGYRILNKNLKVTKMEMEMTLSIKVMACPFR